MDYIGEQLLPGKLGHFFVLLSVVSSLVATLSYFLSAQSKNPETANDWKKLARLSFIIEAVSVFAIFITLFYIISNHRFEYKYAWQHSSLSLETKYLLACFWEGQEGSFLLWSIWHCIIGLILIKTAKKWEAPVMTIVSFAQLLLGLMIVGIYLFGKKIGLDPFVLLRHSGVLDNAPALHTEMDVTKSLRTDYLSLIKDGNDLNPLLQNYWMVIHPPVLFLGFASSIVPFAYAIAGLWKKQDGINTKADWINPALPWTLFCMAFLGTGIMMGAMWAYESLTFGGYWAWDPVENASLVPWIVIVAGAHTLLVYKHSGRALQATYFFLAMGFILVLYSTFLTRSGILGDTSVHSFTDLGMNAQLYLLLFTFLWGSAVLTAKNRGQKIYFAVSGITLLIASYYIALPAIAFITLIAGLSVLGYNIFTQVVSIKKEEQSSSREFWMFIGSLVLFLSSVIIIFITSFPVINKVFGSKLATAENVMYQHNSIQIFFAIIIAILSGVAQYLKYKKTTQDFFLKKIIYPLVISAGLSFAVIYFGKINYGHDGPMFLAAIWLAITSSIFTIVANVGYVWIGLKGDLKISGASVAHFGFGLVLLGILISASKKEILSLNTSGIFLNFGEGSKENPGENLTLVKGLRTDMGKYWVTYEKARKHPQKSLWYYDIDFQRKDGKEKFTLTPNAFVNYKNNEGLMANPSSRHYWDHDVFTYITALPSPEKNKDTSSFKTKQLKPGDSLFYTKGYIIFQDVRSRDSLPKELFGENGSLYEAGLKVFSKTGSIFSIEPKLAFAKGEIIAIPDTIVAENLIVQLQKVSPDKTIEVGVKESNTVLEYITLKAYKFPMIRLLWFGVLITVIGTLMSMVRRISQNRRNKALS